MPMMINGVGTTVVSGRGEIGWDGATYTDAMEWFVIFLLPIFPYRAVHVFQWRGAQYMQFPIQWSRRLVLRSFLNGLIGFTGLMAFMAGVLAAIFWFVPDIRVAAMVMTPITLLLIAAYFVGRKVWNHTDRRDQDIRFALGPSNTGSSDPVDWLDDMLSTTLPPMELYGTRKFSEAVQGLLERSDFSRAMWASRLTAALEDRDLGEQLTDEVLNYPGVAEAIQVVRTGEMTWADVMFPKQAAGEPSVPPPLPTPAADNQPQTKPPPLPGSLVERVQTDRRQVK